MQNRHFIVQLSSSPRALDFLILNLIVSPTGLKSGQYSFLQFLALVHLTAGVLQFNSLAVLRHPRYNLNMYCTVPRHPQYNLNMNCTEPRHPNTNIFVTQTQIPNIFVPHKQIPNMFVTQLQIQNTYGLQTQIPNRFGSQIQIPIRFGS